MAVGAAALARSRHALTCARGLWNIGTQDLCGISTTVTALHPPATTSRTLTRLAVVGSGPAGFYFADRILKHLGNEASVDIIDRLPTPFGLVRAGVAPDHPDTKNVINKFTSIASDERVRFFGNVQVGKDVSMDELRALYHCVLLSYGASNDRKLGIPGEDLTGVFSARQFVNWYNGHPDFVRLPVDLSKTESVGIVGLGNVALDCARILLKPPEALETTDITDYALQELRRSAVQSVHIIGRRGPFQAQFSGKELREVLNLDNSSVTMYPSTYEPTELDLKEPRKNQKCANEMMKAHGRQPSSGPRRSLHLHFLADPKALNPAPDAADCLGSITLEHTRLEPSGESQRAVGTGEHENVPMQMLLKSVGYRAESLPGVPFDSRRSVVPNIGGRVVEATGSEAVVPGLYVAGWLGRGPTGIIGTNLVDATLVAQNVADDLAQGAPMGGGTSGDLAQLLKERGVRCITWADWLAIDAAETAAGAKRNRPRVKITDVTSMLEICKS